MNHSSPESLRKQKWVYMKKMINPVTVTLMFFVAVQLFTLITLFVMSLNDQQQLASPKGKGIIRDAQYVDINITPQDETQTSD